LRLVLEDASGMNARTSLPSGGKTKLPATLGALRGWSSLFFSFSSLLDTSLFLISTWAGLGRGKAVHPFLFLVFTIDDWPVCTLRLLSLSYMHLRINNNKEEGSKGEENGITWVVPKSRDSKSYGGIPPPQGLSAFCRATVSQEKRNHIF